MQAFSAFFPNITAHSRISSLLNTPSTPLIYLCPHFMKHTTQNIVIMQERNVK